MAHQEKVERCRSRIYCAAKHYIAVALAVFLHTKWGDLRSTGSVEHSCATRGYDGPNRRLQVPTYEYECSKCGHGFECFQQMKDSPLEVCPECGGPVRRLIGSGAGIIFKGKGFYATDYRRGSCPADGSACESAKPSDSGGHTCSGPCCKH